MSDLDAIKLQRMSPIRFREIVNDYESSTLDQSYMPNANSLKVAKECDLSMSSSLPRATLSCELLGLGETNIPDPCFQESALPYFEWSSPKLTFFTWAILFRLMWLCGFSKNGESLKKAKLRSKLGVDKLEFHASEGKSILLLGHGIINRLLIRELKRRKWVVKEHTGEKYWSYTVLEHAA